MAWNRLAADIPFRRWEWCTSWWLNYGGANRSLLVLLVTDAEGTLVGVAPWFLETNVISGRTIRFLGSGEVCSDYTSVLAACGQEQLVAQMVANWLCNDVRRMGLARGSKALIATTRRADCSPTKCTAVNMRWCERIWRIAGVRNCRTIGKPLWPDCRGRRA